MAEPTENRSERDDRLEKLLAEYVRAEDAGQPLDREQFVAEHPELAGELRSFLRNRDALRRLADPLLTAAETPTIGLEGIGLAPGKIRYLGDYELLEEIARGGMGVVYKARQVSLNRVVAVKMILAGQLADDSAVQRFRQEAEAAASLDHPAIVPIYEVGQHAGQHYFAMGYVPGSSLAARLAAGPLPAREAAELVRQVAEAVQFAHERGIIHRDLKPANILLDKEGRPRVTDFGLAKRTAAGHSLTETGQVLGTPGYMPPEQVQAKEIGPGADVYALGAILYALLTGRPPFVSATPMETMLQVLNADPAPPRALNPSVPRDLDTIVMKCLEKRPTWRYATAQELADELSRFLAGESIRARRPGIVEQGARWLGKQKRSVSLAIGVAVATVVVVIGTFAGTAAYRKSLEGKLGLNTEHARLVAEIADSDGRPVLPPFTIPTQQPVVLPAGEYVLRASGKELLSEDFQVRIDRGHTLQFPLSLAFQSLWPPAEIAGTFYIVPSTVGQAAALFDLHQKGVRLSAPTLKQELWSRTFDPLDDAKLKAIPTFRWNWQYQDTMYSSGFGQYDFRPQLLKPCPDLDGDKLGDIVLACRHQPVVIALGTNKGDTLWAYAPPEIAKIDDVLQKQDASGGGFRTGTIVGEPLVVPDLDGDGTVDLIVAAVLAIPDLLNDEVHPQRLLDAVSGKTGKRIWSHPLPDEWFAIEKGGVLPRAAAWLARIRGSGGGHRVHHPYGNAFRDNYQHSISGDAVAIPYMPQLLNVNRVEVLCCVAGSRVVLLDPRSGAERGTAQPVGFFPNVAPRLVRTATESALLLMQNLADEQAGPKYQVQSLSNYKPHALWLWSPSGGEAIGQHAPLLAHYDKDTRDHQPRPKWPLVADLNGDGQDEVLTANGTSLDQPAGYYHTPSSRAWGAVSLLAKAPGKPPVWTRRLETVDQQIDQFTVGPDINADGWRDLFAANIFSRGMNSGFVYVDAISGQTGEILWSSGQPFDMQGRSQIDSELIGELCWWSETRLVVPVIQGENGRSRGLFVFAARDGELLHNSPDLVPAEILDGDGDGVDDLFCYAPANPARADQGGRLLSFRGTAEVAWRHIGGTWQAGDDYDGDGSEDAISGAVEYVYGGQMVAARSGIDGRSLFQAAADGAVWAGAGVVPLAADLNGDGVHDFLAEDHQRGGDGETPFLHAFSGKTGRELWQPTVGAGSVGQTYLAEAHDLDRDQRPELIYIGELSFAGPGGTAPSYTATPLWLVVVEGNTGKLRWKQQLHTQAATNPQEALSLPVAYADLNGDGTEDVVVPGVREKGQYPELRAYHGQTGDLLWDPVPLPGDGGWKGMFVVNHLPRAVTADLDGDGHLEILVQDSFLPTELATRDLTKAERTDPAGGYTGEAANRSSRVLVLDGRTGQEKWHIDIPTGGIGEQTHDGGGIMTRYRSRPLVVRRGKDKPPALCVWLFAPDWQKPVATLILLDTSGNELWRVSANLKIGNRYFRAFVHDLTGDGVDEIVFVDGESLHALDATTHETLWKQPILGGGTEILSIEPATDKTPAQVVVAFNRQVLGLAGPTGKLLWSCAGLPVELSPVPDTKAQLLRDLGGKCPHRVLLTSGTGETSCFVATPAVDSPMRPRPMPATTQPAKRDPRFARPLPWGTDDVYASDPLARPLFMLHGALLSLVLVVFPVYLLYHLAWKRRYSLGTFLLFPVAVGLAIVVLRIPIERIPGSSPSESRFQAVALALPGLFGIALLIYWLIRGRWIRASL
ncbi:MAG: protein kinase, partial [Pirellulaceae bacterium]|nr:protein kinase [Pirellulaceae bacterium]